MRPTDHHRLERMIIEHGLFRVMVAAADASDRRAAHLRKDLGEHPDVIALEKAANKLRTFFGPRLANELNIGTGRF